MFNLFLVLEIMVVVTDDSLFFLNTPLTRQNKKLVTVKLAAKDFSKLSWSMKSQSLGTTVWKSS